MDEEILHLAKSFLYFNEQTEDKEKVYKIFCKTWNRIPIENQRTIIKNLELIIVGPYDDSMCPGSKAVTNESPITFFKCRINWNPNFPDENSKILLHELGHVLFNHPNEGHGKSGDDRKLHQLQADMEVNKWMLKIFERELKRADNK